MKPIYIVLMILVYSCTKNFIPPSSTCVDNLDFLQSSAVHPKGDTLQKILDEYISKGVPGATMLLADQNGVWIGSAGFADIKKGIAMQPCHILKPGSVAKMIIGNLIWQLQEDGLLNINDLIGDYIPEVAAAITNGDRITIKMLLNHTSGIYQIGRDLNFNLAVVNDFTRPWTADEIIQYFTDKPATNEPGEELNYSNTNTLISELIIEAVTSKSVDVVLDEMVFSPLGMQNSVYYDYSTEFPLDHLAQGYLDFSNDGKDIQNVSDVNPGSGNGYTGLYTNAEDMYLFMKAVFVDHSLISSTSLDTILNSFVISSGGSYASSSGGIHQQDIHFFGDSLHAYGHSGGDIGYTANVIYINELQTIVVLNYNYGTQFCIPRGLKTISSSTTSTDFEVTASMISSEIRVFVLL